MAQTGIQAPSATPSPQEVAVQMTASAFAQCVAAGIQRVAPTLTPDGGASAVLVGCTSQREQLAQAVDAMIAQMPEAEKPLARQEFQSQMALAPGRVAAAIAQSRIVAPAQ